MLRSFSLIFPLIFLRYVSGHGELCGGNKTGNTLSCTTQVFGQQDNTDDRYYDLCKMDLYPPNSPQCGAMTFGPLVANTQMGGVTLKPYHFLDLNTKAINYFPINRTVLNITFSNIKWKTMRFRFQDKIALNSYNHCRNIAISKDAKVDDQSVLYYDCYWPMSDPTRSIILDFEAANDGNTYRGQYYFKIPTPDMLSDTVAEDAWKPFTYIEIFPSIMKLHIMPPPKHLNITAYDVRLMKDCGKESCQLKSKTIQLRNRTDEVTYNYNFLSENGFFHFVVRPIHDRCTNGVGCMMVETPKIQISSVPQPLNICIASVTALIVASLFAYYIVLRFIRRFWCKDPKFTMVDEIPLPPKVLVIYSPTNRLHAACVSSFVNYLRMEYGLDLMYDCDITNTAHGDPYRWAEEAFRIASNVMYIVGPAEESNVYNNIYDRPIISPHKDVDLLLLSFLKVNRISKCPKDVMNVFFEHSNGQIPLETKHDKVFFLLKDWQKLISYLSKNLLPKRQIMKSERGRCFLEDLTRAKKILNGNIDDIIIKAEKINTFEKKTLL